MTQRRADNDAEYEILGDLQKAISGIIAYASEDEEKVLLRAMQKKWMSDLSAIEAAVFFRVRERAIG